MDIDWSQREGEKRRDRQLSTGLTILRRRLLSSGLVSRWWGKANLVQARRRREEVRRCWCLGDKVGEARLGEGGARCSSGFLPTRTKNPKYMTRLDIYLVTLIS